MKKVELHCGLNEIIFESNNPKLICSLIKNNYSPFPYYGKNEDGEDVEIHIKPLSVVYKTYQNNGWSRVNYFDENGLPEGETFEGRWK